MSLYPLSKLLDLLTSWNSGGGLKVDGSGTPLPVSGTFWQATQPVSGTVTANVGTTNGLALDATLTGGTMKLSGMTNKYAADTNFTITLASLANSATVGRQSTLVDNTSNKYLSALVYLSIKMGTAPTANTPIFVYLIRSNNNAPIIDDGGTTTDAGITINNAQLLGVINCSATTTGAVYVGIFDTSQLGPLGPKWGIAVVNNTGVALDATEGNHLKTFIGVSRTI
jgi:hypothetical protein